MIKHTTETVEVGPLGLFFTNKNVQIVAAAYVTA
jgi:hypothetical protein